MNEMSNESKNSPAMPEKFHIESKPESSYGKYIVAGGVVLAGIGAIALLSYVFGQEK